MNRFSLANSAALCLALAGTLALGWPSANLRVHTTRARPLSVEGAPTPVSIGNGAFAIPDAAGHLVPLRHYQRIISTNLVTDRLLVELCEPTRILAISRAAAERKRDGFRYQGMTTVDGFGPAEAMVALQPDLVLTNSFGSPGSAERLRGGIASSRTSTRSPAASTPTRSLISCCSKFPNARKGSLGISRIACAG